MFKTLILKKRRKHMQDDERVTYRYSSNFIMRKALLLISMFLVGFAAMQVLNYETTEDVAATTVEQVVEETDTTEETQTEEPEVTETAETETETEAEPEEEEAPEVETSTDPFTITQISDIDPVITGSGDNAVYSYTLDNQALIEVRLSNADLPDVDFNWTHRLNDDPGTLDILTTPTEFCQNGTDGCSAGNGVLEIGIVPTSGSDKQYYVYVRDALVHNRDTALDFYGPIIESLTLNN